jgi:uncharacterized damage-inducible protein DinB
MWVGGIILKEAEKMTSLTSEELQAWVERTTQGWRQLIAKNPDVLSLPCDVRETNSVAGLIQHIVAVELRYAQRLRGIAESAYDQIPLGSAEEMFAVHDKAMALLPALDAWRESDWEQKLEFTTRSAGTLQASRRVILIHLFMHSIRHYAQLATVVRQHGVKPDWAMDYLFMSAT